ncbi:MAG: YggT family protein [Anaerovoracaceae bacterium]|jgi:YggT family protein|nr:YggT family protein [Casaltella massiliensis]
MKATIIYAIYMFCNILVALLLIRALMSWFVRDMYSPMGKIYGAIIRFTEPIVMPFRRLLSRFNTGMLDFSVLLAMLVIEMAGNILVKIIVLF